MNNYDYLGRLSEGFQRFKIGIHPKCKCGFMNETGNVVIPPIYSNVRDFHEGFAAVKIGNWATGKWGYVNYSGDLVIDFLFDKPRKFSDGYAKVILEGEWCFINLNGEKIISLNDYIGGSNFHNGYAIVCKSNEYTMKTKFGIIDKTGTEVIPLNEKNYQLRVFLEGESIAEYVQWYQSTCK
jgi:hypothetical protein